MRWVLDIVPFLPFFWPNGIVARIAHPSPTRRPWRSGVGPLRICIRHPARTNRESDEKPTELKALAVSLSKSRLILSIALLSASKRDASVRSWAVFERGWFFCSPPDSGRPVMSQYHTAPLQIALTPLTLAALQALGWVALTPAALAGGADFTGPGRAHTFRV